MDKPVCRPTISSPNNERMWRVWQAPAATESVALASEPSTPQRGHSSPGGSRGRAPAAPGLAAAQRAAVAAEVVALRRRLAQLGADLRGLSAGTANASEAGTHDQCYGLLVYDHMGTRLLTSTIGNLHLQALRS